MEDLIERLKVDLNDASKESEPYLYTWTEAIIRRLWEKAHESEESLDSELITLGQAAKKRQATRRIRRPRKVNRESDRSLSGWAAIILERNKEG
jgi:hypothetical protein